MLAICPTIPQIPIRPVGSHLSGMVVLQAQRIAVSLCVEIACRLCQVQMANDYQYYLLNWRTKKNEVRQRQQRVSGGF